MGVTLEEVEAQNRELMVQVAALQQLLAMQLSQQAPEPEGYLVIRSLIPGFTTMIHPDIRYRGVSGNRVIPPFSEIAVPASWKDSPNLRVSQEKGVVEVREVSTIPEHLVTMPEIPSDSPVLEPEHRRIALAMALNGANSDEGDIYSYPESTRLLLETDIQRDTGGVDVGYMQDIYMPVIELALKMEREWRNRKWVVDYLEERITQIVNLTRRRR